MADGRRDGREPVGGIDKGDAGAGATEVAQRDHPAGGHARIVLQRGQRRDGVRDHRSRFGPGKLRERGERVAQPLDGARPPVRGVRHADRVGRWLAAADGDEHGPQRVGDQRVGAMGRSVGGHDAHRVADPVDEVGDDQATFGEVGVFARHADLGRPVRVQRQHRGPCQCGPSHHNSGQIGGPNRQPHALRHVTPFRDKPYPVVILV